MPKKQTKYLKEFTMYILNTNNISSINNSILEDIKLSDIKIFIKNTLKTFNDRNYDIINIRKRREELNQDIQDIYTSFVSGDSYDFSESGKNTGMKSNPNELKHLKIAELKEELKELTNQTFLIEESLKYNRELIKNIFDYYLDPEKATIMKLFYINCFTNSKIATEQLYSIDAVKKNKRKSIDILSNKILEFLLENNTI